MHAGNTTGRNNSTQCSGQRTNTDCMHGAARDSSTIDLWRVGAGNTRTNSHINNTSTRRSPRMTGPGRVGLNWNMGMGPKLCIKSGNLRHATPDFLFWLVHQSIGRKKTISTYRYSDKNSYTNRRYIKCTIYCTYLSPKKTSVHSIIDV